MGQNIHNSKFIVLGNGFSIDIINKISEKSPKNIDLTNLFSKGSDVVFPKTNEKGFLSSKHCPNLWALGANATNSNEFANQLINNVITCSNVRNLSRNNPTTIPRESSIYTKAYFELSSYLRYLFIHYNEMLSDHDLTETIDKVSLISYIKNSIESGYKINIVTYNYDIILERLLQIKKLPFTINTFEQTNNRKKIVIYKPHGSISFSFKKKIQESKQFEIKEEDDPQDTHQFDILYHLNNDYPIINCLIPPAGDSERASFGWIGKMRKNLNKALKDSQYIDELIIMGTSYLHVDRNEIDDILTKINTDTNVKYINPYPSPELNAVLSSLFKNYTHYPTAENLI